MPFAADEAVAAQTEALVPTGLRPTPSVPDAEEDGSLVGKVSEYRLDDPEEIL